jgi:hypothetical protein
MTTPQSNPSYGIPPMPTLELTMEQDFKLRRLEDLLPKAEKEDIITVFMALQKQCYVLSNNVSQLVKEWPSPHHPTTTETTGM